MLFEQLLIQPLQRIDLIDPWQGSIPGGAGTSLLAGAMILRFDQAAVVCTSPLRYMRNQYGTTIGVPGVDGMASLGYRLTLTAPEDADQMFPSGICRKVITPKEWMVPTEPMTAPAAQVLLLAELEHSQATWSVKMRFLGGSYGLFWRPDLDASIEFTPVAHQYTIDQIKVDKPEQDWGWLFPGNREYPFVLDDQVWRSAQVSDWPWPLRRVLRSHQAPEVFYRETMRRALMARFRQTPLLRQRLLALRYPVNCQDLPDGLIEEVAAELRLEVIALAAPNVQTVAQTALCV